MAPVFKERHNKLARAKEAIIKLANDRIHFQTSVDTRGDVEAGSIQGPIL